MAGKNKCSISIEDGYKNSNPIFDKVYNDAIAKYPELKDTPDLVGFMHRKYSDGPLLISELFSMWIKNNFSDDFYDNVTIKSIKPLNKKTSDIFLSISSLADTQYLDLYDNQAMMISQDENNGDNTEYLGDQDSNSITINLKHDGEGYFKNRLFSAINEKVSSQELAKIATAARENSFLDFLKYIKENYPKVEELVTSRDMDRDVLDLASTLFGETELDIIPNRQTLQKLRYFHIFSRPENQRTRQQKKYYIITNYDPETKTILPKGEMVLQDKPNIDLKTKRALSNFLTASFIDVSPATLPMGKKIGGMTAYMSLNDMVTMFKGKENGWYTMPNNFSYSEQKLNDWLKLLLRSKNLTIATLRGGNSGTIILTKVDRYYYDIMFPKEQIKSLESQLPKSFLLTKSKGKIVSRLEKFNYDFNRAFLDYKAQLQNALNVEGGKKLSSFVSDFNQIEELQRKLAVVNYLKYLNKEKELGNIDDKGMDVFKNNIFNLPVEGQISPATGMKEPHLLMGEYLASIIARHEWLKAARGNKYSINDTVENIFNRMRMFASEGLVDRNASKKNILIYDQNQVEYRDNSTGKIISPQEIIEGMKNPVDKDDGIFHSSSESIDEMTYAIGRQKIMEYEHNPKEIKTVGYYLKQNKEVDKEGKQLPDDYIEIKSMEFLALPNFSVIDKKTGKELLTTSKVELEGKPFISITAGAATDIPGQKIDKFGSLNVAKTLGGEFEMPKDSSYVIGEIPAQSTRTIILPGTKSHTDAAAGVTWGNSFNIDTPIMNEVRKLVNNEFKNILDQSIDRLHNIRTSPDYARRFLRYQTKVRNDLTDEVTEMYEKLGGKPIYHPMFFDIFKQSLFNITLADGGMKGKISVDKGNPGKMSQGMSTSAKLKADMTDSIKLGKDGEPEGIIIGINNDRSFNYVSDLYLQKASKEESDKFKNLSTEEKVPIINNFVAANEIIFGIVRQPVQSAGGYVFRKVLSFDVDAGDVIIAHNYDVAYRLIGDSDGDTVSASVWPNQKVVKKLMSLLQDDSLKILMNISSDLNIFDPSEKTHAADYVGFTKTIVNSIKGFGGMGIITNLKTAASVLELKMGDSVAKLSNGTEFKVIKGLDAVIMDYAPLKDEVTEKDLPSFAKIVNKEGEKYDGVGKKYLQTIALHERLILLNAATDNTKEHLIISKWGITFDKVYTKIFKRVDGKDFSAAEIKTLKKLVDIFNYSRRRSAVDRSGDKMDDTGFYRASKEVYTFLNQSKEGRSEEVIGRVNNLGKPLDIKLESIEISSEVTTDEVLISRPYEKFIQDKALAERSTKIKSWNGTDISPLEWTKTYKNNINLHALYGYTSQEESNNIKGLRDKIKEIVIENKIDMSNYDVVKKDVKAFANRFDVLWRVALKEAKGGKAKFTKSPTAKIYDYNEVMDRFVRNEMPVYNKLIEKHGKLANMMLTWHMLDGLGQIENVQLYYPMEMTDGDVMRAYAESYEDLNMLFDTETGLDVISSDVEISKQFKRNFRDPFDPRNYC